MNIQPIPTKYADFFLRTYEEHKSHILLQGGRRCGKTINTYNFLHILANECRGLTITTLCGNFDNLKATFQDFESAIGVPIHQSYIDGYVAKGTNNTSWKFLAIDDKQNAQGKMCDILFCNEALNIRPEVIDTIASGVADSTYYNFNPVGYSDVMKRVEKDESNILRTMWKDNPYLTPNQVAEFEAMKERAMRPNATKYDQYMYKVYYLGEFAQMSGAIFTNRDQCSLQFYKDIPTQEVIGIDFGFALNGDPTAVVGVKLWQGKIYTRCYIYQRGLNGDLDLAKQLRQFGIDEYSTIVADYGGNGKQRINTLRTADNGTWQGDYSNGLPVMNAIKTGVVEGLMEILAYGEGGTVVVCNEGLSSEFLLSELEEYKLNEHGNPEGNDHAIDAMRYAFHFLRMM